MDARATDAETRVDRADHGAIRMWLRMLATNRLVETRTRRLLQERYATTLPRFDLMAQLERVPRGLKMGELSKRMMVTGGNVTGLTDELEREGVVTRAPSPDDRRAWIVSLTPKGRRSFEAMASEHEQWILEMFSGLDMKTVKQLHSQLGQLRVHVMRNEAGGEEAS